MKSKLHLAIAVILVAATSSFAVTVTGHVLLQDQTDHSGSRILFTAASPSAETDSSFTDESGFYSLDLAIGIYDIEFSHEGFVQESRDDIGILSAQTLDSVLLIASYNTLIDEISGTLNPGTYYIIGDIMVPQDSVLNLLPGTDFIFIGNYRFFVHGQLLAIGSEQYSIRFTASDPEDSLRWRGISISNSQDTSRMEYCVVEYSSEDGISVSGNLICSHCFIHSNNENGLQNDHFVNISQSFIMNNMGSGINCHSGLLHVSNCHIENNLNSGLYIHIISEATIEECTVKNNFGWYGGGIYLNLSGCFINHTLFVGNETAIYSTYGNLHVKNSTFIANNGSSIVVIDTDSSSINSTIVAFSSGMGIICSEDDVCQITYSNFFGNAGGNFSDSTTYLGQLVTTNANGDSADVYLNIQSNPMFVDNANGNYHLLENSPCINAGDPNLPLDPDGTIADIGAFYYPLGSSANPNEILPMSHILLSNYPNPFNPATQINFSLPQSGLVSLNVYDILGRNVAELLKHQITSAGLHNVSWNAADLPAGSYFVRLITPSQTKIHRIVLVK